MTAAKSGGGREEGPEGRKGHLLRVYRLHVNVACKCRCLYSYAVYTHTQFLSHSPPMLLPCSLLVSSFSKLSADVMKLERKDGDESKSSQLASLGAIGEAEEEEEEGGDGF